MAFAEYNITALTEIPPLVKTFAEGLGFTVTGTSANPIVQRPGDSGAPTFKLLAVSQGSGESLIRYL